MLLAVHRNCFLGFCALISFFLSIPFFLVKGSVLFLKTFFEGQSFAWSVSRQKDPNKLNIPTRDRMETPVQGQINPRTNREA